MPNTHISMRHNLRWRLPNTAFPPAWRTRYLVSALALILALGALSASGNPGQAGAHAAHAAHAAQAAHGAHNTATIATAARHRFIGRADIHIDDVPGAGEFELNLSISQTESGCQTPLHGQICLRYDILLDDAPVQAGYGLISPGDVTVTRTAITLRVNTRHEPHLMPTAGAGGIITLTWAVPSGVPQPAQRSTALATATVQGSVLGYSIPSTSVTAGVLMYGDTTGGA